MKCLSHLILFFVIPFADLYGILYMTILQIIDTTFLVAQILATYRVSCSALLWRGEESFFFCLYMLNGIFISIFFFPLTPYILGKSKWLYTTHTHVYKWSQVCWFCIIPLFLLYLEMLCWSYLCAVCRC